MAEIRPGQTSISQMLNNLQTFKAAQEASPVRPGSLSLKAPQQLFQALAAGALSAAVAGGAAQATDHHQASLNTQAMASAQTEVNFVHSPLLGPDDRVLHIGDSHTVGIYGQEMDKHLRSSGAKVETYGSAGSSPHWWITGQTTRSGFFSRNQDEVTDQPAKWNDPHATPQLKNLLERFRPNVVVFSLGANLINASPAAIEKQMREVADMAKASGTRIIWVGPPDGRESTKPSSKQNELYQTLEKVAKEYGDFIDSRPLTEYPASGGDGVHYWGKEGVKRAKSWASDVFQQLQALPK